MPDDVKPIEPNRYIQAAAVIALLAVGYVVGCWHENRIWIGEATRFGHGFVDDDGDFHWGPPHVWPGSAE